MSIEPFGNWEDSVQVKNKSAILNPKLFIPVALYPQPATTPLCGLFLGKLFSSGDRGMQIGRT